MNAGLFPEITVAKLLAPRRPFLFDGAMGTMILARRLTPDVAPEVWNVGRIRVEVS